MELERVAQFVCKNESPLVRTMHSISSHYRYNKSDPLWDLDSCVLVFLRLMPFLHLLLLLIEMLYCVLVLTAGNEPLPLLLLLIEILYCVFVLTVGNESFYV